MRIAILGEGSVVHTLRWAEYFQAMGDEVRLFTLETPPEDFSVDWQRVGRRDRSHALSYTLASRKLSKALDRFDPDLVNAHFIPNYGWMGALAGRRPLAVSAWGSDVLVNPKRSPFHRWRLHFVLGRADLITSDAEMMSAEIRRHLNGSSNLLTVPMGVDLRFFERGAEELVREPVLLQYRHLEPVYDLSTLIAALPEFFGRHPGWRLRLAGEGSQRAKLETLARRLGVADRVEFLGRLPRERLIEELRRASLYVSTSLSDSTSVSLLEAMSMGAYPVLSDIPANREWVDEGACGLYFPPGEVRALSAALIRATELSEAERGEAARANRSIIAKRAIWERNMARVRDSFLQLSGRRK